MHICIRKEGTDSHIDLGIPDTFNFLYNKESKIEKKCFHNLMTS
jgi:hypothetical protein